MDSKQEGASRGKAERKKTDYKQQYTQYDYHCAFMYLKFIFTEDYSKKMLTILWIVWI